MSTISLRIFRLSLNSHPCTNPVTKLFQPYSKVMVEIENFIWAGEDGHYFNGLVPGKLRSYKFSPRILISQIYKLDKLTECGGC